MSDLGTPADWGDSETGLWSSNNPLAPRLITLRRERDEAQAECERLRAALRDIETGKYGIPAAFIAQGALLNRSPKDRAALGEADDE